MEHSYLFQDKAPYPKLGVCAENTENAQAMLSNIGDSNSEMSAISLYLYNSIITGGLFEEIATCFHKIMVVEMHHLDLYAQLARMLGADPRLWSCQDKGMVYWTPEYNNYPGRMDQLLENAICGEEAAIKKYMSQCEWIQDAHITCVIRRIIADEELHLSIFKDLLKRWQMREEFF